MWTPAPHRAWGSASETQGLPLPFTGDALHVFRRTTWDPLMTDVLMDDDGGATRTVPPAVGRRIGAPTPAGPTRHVLLLGADPELGDGMDPDELAAARRRVAAPLLRLAEGPWTGAVPEAPGAFAVLVLDGLLVRELRLGRRPAAQFVGPGDVLPLGSPAIDGVDCRAATGTDLALLDERFLAASRRWPSLTARMIERGARWADRALLHQAIASIPRVDDRIVALFDHLAERWGRVTLSGVEVPLSLTHAAIGRLVGAERPTVSLALKALSDAGVLRRDGDRWRLRASACADIAQHGIGSVAPG
jgi:CRP-like cAMP-binding protein